MLFRLLGGNYERVMIRIYLFSKPNERYILVGGGGQVIRRLKRKIKTGVEEIHTFVTPNASGVTNRLMKAPTAADLALTLLQTRCLFDVRPCKYLGRLVSLWQLILFKK